MGTRAFEWVNSRSAVASLVRVVVLMVLGLCLLAAVRSGWRVFVFRAGAGRPALVQLDRSDVARYQNDSHINTKALLCFVLDLLDAASVQVREQIGPLVSREVLESAEGAAAIERVSRDSLAMIHESLTQVLLSTSLLWLHVEGSDSEVPSLDLPERYRPDVHRIVWYDQWIPRDDLFVWITPLVDSAALISEYKLKMVTLSVCVTRSGRPHMAVVVYPFRDGNHSFWGLHERGNDMHLKVASAHKFFPERFGVVADDSRGTADLVSAAFGSDADLYSTGTVTHQLLAALSGYADLALFTQPLRLCDLCAGHLLMSMYGGRVTDLRGREVTYIPYLHRQEGGLLAALYYHKQILANVQKALRQSPAV